MGKADIGRHGQTRGQLEVITCSQEKRLSEGSADAVGREPENHRGAVPGFSDHVDIHEHRGIFGQRVPLDPRANPIGKEIEERGAEFGAVNLVRYETERVDEAAL